MGTVHFQEATRPDSIQMQLDTSTTNQSKAAWEPKKDPLKPGDAPNSLPDCFNKGFKPLKPWWEG